MDELTFEAGHVFFAAGDTGDVAFLVQEGAVELLPGPAESPSRVGIVASGDVFGEMVLVEERAHPVTARAVTAGRVVPISRDAFEGHLLTMPAPIVESLRALFERLRSLTERLGHESESASAEFSPPAALAGQSERPGPSEFPVAQGETGDWTVVLHPLTRKAAETLPDEGLLVTRFPLRVGRAAAAGEGEAMDLNDLWLLDEKPFNISRNHCEIYLDHDGPALRDRGSHLGCIVNEKPIGGLAGKRSGRLEPGDNVVVIGSRISLYQFRVTVSPRQP